MFNVCNLFGFCFFSIRAVFDYYLLHDYCVYDKNIAAFATYDKIFNVY